ncbi:hypothetical protein [Pollutibacter soli]|uniref:hypothetical protein n=1 Tax=Pollutibacter soli TaxID=3034157 RepID=UPI0030140484
MSPIAVSVIHPDFQQVKKAGRPLHLLAAILIVANAFLYVQLPDASRFYFWAQLLVAADILVLIVAGKDLMSDSPRFNLFFRLTEVIVFSTFCILLLIRQDWIAGIIQAIVAGSFIYLFYNEKKTIDKERISIQHLGINIPGIPNDIFIPWVEITDVEITNAEIIMITRSEKIYRYELNRELSVDDLEIISQYKGYYLKN